MIDRVCADHPAHADTIRTAVMAAMDSGLAGADLMADLRVPERVGDLLLLERLGAGGMGVVFRARDPALDRDVAVKVLRPELALSSRALARFRIEAEAAAALRHPNIVPVHGVGVEGALPWFSMELIEGMSLEEKIQEHRKSGGDWSLFQRLETFNKICDAIAHAHKNEMIQ